MRRIAFATLITLLLVSCASSAPQETLIFSLDDPRGDDHGDGKLVYPMSGDPAKGELDLIRFAAYREPAGTRFEATFAKPIRKPGRQTIDEVGTSLENVARFGFYNLNLDVYIDTDHVPGSGSTSTLPGRKVVVDPVSAWDRAVVLTPQPGLASVELKQLVVKNASEEAKAEKQRLTADARNQLREDVERYVYFPDTIRIIGNRIQFYVPDEALGGPAQPTWSYIVAVSGADIVERVDKAGRLTGSDIEGLMILPISEGKPQLRFGGAKEDDPLQPPLVDITVPPGMQQESILSNEGPNGMDPVKLYGVVPAGK